MTAAQDAKPERMPGSDTRARLLDAGLRLFGGRGFDGVTSRQLATEAGVNQAAVAYHFGGMRNLYNAVARQLVDETEPQFAPLREGLEEGVRTAGGERIVLARLAARWASGMLRQFMGEERMRWRAGLVVREYTQPSEAFDILYKGRIEPLHKAVSGLAAAATGRRPTDPECVVLAHALVGQILVFGIARIVLWARLGWEEQSPERIDLIVRTVVASVVASLGLPPVDRKEMEP